MKILPLQLLLMATVAAFDCQGRIGARRLEQRLRASLEDEQIEKFRITSSRGSSAVKRKIPKDEPGSWESFKSAIYGTVDGVGSLSEKLASGAGDSGVEGGYSNIENSVLNQNSNLSPGQRLMNEYKARSKGSPVQTAPSQGSAFDAFKQTVYGGVDAASQVFSNEKTDNQEALRSFKPLERKTLSSSEVQAALPDLQSDNPITRKIAETKIRNWEEKERKRQRASEREEAARKFKETVYQVGDVLVASIETAAAVPDRTQVIASNVKKTVDEIPVKVDNVVTTVASIPDQVKAKSDQVQDSVKTTVQNTRQAIDEVKAIPAKIENSVKETQQKVSAVATAVDEAATNVKVMVGLEKPIPKPPKKPPPPPPTASDVGMKIAGSVVRGVATGTAKFAWWAGKGVAVSAWNGVQSAYAEAADKGNPPVEDQGPVAKASIKEVDDEVQEALDLAQSALEFADQGSPPTPDTKMPDSTNDDKKQ